MAFLIPEPYPMPAWDEEDEDPWTTCEDVQGEEMEWLIDRSVNLPPSKVAGGMIRWAKDDGYAWYLVLSDDPLTLQWVPYKDRYRVSDAIISELNTDDVKLMLESEKELHKLYASAYRE